MRLLAINNFLYHKYICTSTFCKIYGHNSDRLKSITKHTYNLNALMLCVFYSTSDKLSISFVGEWQDIGFIMFAPCHFRLLPCLADLQFYSVYMYKMYSAVKLIKESHILLSISLVWKAIGHTIAFHRYFVKEKEDKKKDMEKHNPR